MNQEKIGKFIAELRKENNMTQEEFAEKLNVNNRTVSRWENGKSMPDLSLLTLISKELGIGVNDLLSGERIDKKHYQESFEKNVVNIVSNNDKINKKNRIKRMYTYILTVLILTPLFMLCCGQFLKAPWISFSSFKIMNKANQFYSALINNDIDKINTLLTDKKEIQWDTLVSSSSTENFLKNLKTLKERKIEYTSFKAKQFYYNNAKVTSYPPEDSWGPLRNDFLVEYEMCFKNYNEKACVILVFQLDEQTDKINFFVRVDNLVPKNDKYEPIIGKAFANKLQAFVNYAFLGFSLDEIEENVDNSFPEY